MNTEILFALTLSAVFFGFFVWLFFYARRQERQAKTLEEEHAKGPEASTKKRVS